MAAVIADKYHLKTIHEQIDLFDRKIAHLRNFEKFDTDAERDLAARKLSQKRETLVQAAQRLAAEGIEFKASELPRSLRPKEEAGAVKAEAAEAAPEEIKLVPAAPASTPRRQSNAPFAGLSLDWQASVREYMEKKGKA